jgi:hypothetical protein
MEIFRNIQMNTLINKLKLKKKASQFKNKRYHKNAKKKKVYITIHMIDIKNNLIIPCH